MQDMEAIAGFLLAYNIELYWNLIPDNLLSVPEYESTDTDVSW